MIEMDPSKMMAGIKQHRLRPWRGKTWDDSPSSRVFRMGWVRQHQGRVRVMGSLGGKGTLWPHFTNLQAFYWLLSWSRDKTLERNHHVHLRCGGMAKVWGPLFPHWQRHDWCHKRKTGLRYQLCHSTALWAKLCYWNSWNQYYLTYKMEMIVSISWGCWEESRNMKRLIRLSADKDA